MVLTLIEADWIRYKLVQAELETWFTVTGVMKAELRAGEDAAARRRLPAVQGELETIQRSAAKVRNETRRADIQSRLDALRTAFEWLWKELR
jgi:hypothetical protein